MPRAPKSAISSKAVERLSLYRRLLVGLLQEDQAQVYSHELARRAGATAAQVRRDLMTIGFAGSSRRGYAVEALIERIKTVLAQTSETTVALVGVGNLGRAILSYFARQRPAVRFVAAFDADPEHAGRVIHGVRCHPTEQMVEVLRRENIHVAVIAVPARNAQAVADRLVGAGVRGLLNFAPVRLHTPHGVFVEDIDMTIALDKVAFYARQLDETPENNS